MLHIHLANLTAGLRSATKTLRVYDSKKTGYVAIDKITKNFTYTGEFGSSVFNYLLASLGTLQSCDAKMEKLAEYMETVGTVILIHD